MAAVRARVLVGVIYDRLLKAIEVVFSILEAEQLGDGKGRSGDAGQVQGERIDRFGAYGMAATLNRANMDDGRKREKTKVDEVVETKKRARDVVVKSFLIGNSAVCVSMCRRSNSVNLHHQKETRERMEENRAMGERKRRKNMQR